MRLSQRTLPVHSGTHPLARKPARITRFGLGLVELDPPAADPELQAAADFARSYNGYSLFKIGVDEALGILHSLAAKFDEWNPELAFERSEGGAL